MNTDQILGYEKTDPSFGSALPNGSCNAIIRNERFEGMCGWPRKADGTCAKGHPAEPGRESITTIENCNAKAHLCRCSKPKGHVETGDSVHDCRNDGCGGQWTGDYYDAETFKVVRLPGLNSMLGTKP